MVVPEPELKQVSDDTTQPGSSLNTDAVPATNAGRRKLNGKALESTDKYNSNEKQPSGAKKLKQDSDNRPVGLEERHTLSIAETRKRRESVFLDEHLFIPKELARSNLRSSAVNSFSKLSRHKDHRMLKFTVGTGRARHVANQLKKAQMAALQSSSKESPDESELIDGNEVTSYEETKEDEDPMATKEEAIYLPDVDAESAANDPVIHYPVIIDAEEDDNTKEVEDPMAPKEEEGIRMPEMDAANDSMIHFEVISDAVEDDNTKEVEDPMATKEEAIYLPDVEWMLQMIR
ncbi:uncharacterized protein LOC117893451 [Drosophila subobscura]|uniref:uncharacterized protein LOC117893451 n=1 Tax=Drosophila subobscura TaxID=7241 RepID=UPI00155A238A|nr:uncharacterized protein LOC117893451 [Drosophila subobscura]